jgi:hypothetical protein
VVGPSEERSSRGAYSQKGPFTGPLRGRAYSEKGLFRERLIQRRGLWREKGPIRGAHVEAHPLAQTPPISQGLVSVAILVGQFKASLLNAHRE